MKIRRIFLLLALLVMATILAACGGDDSDDSSGGGGGDSGGFNFSEQFSQEGVSFTYPEGWVLVDDGGQVVIANNQAAADAIVAGGNPPADAIAVLFIPFPTGGAFTASEVANLFTQEAVSEDGLQFGSDLTETTIGDYSGVRADVTIPETDDGPGGEGALYVIDYSENIVFVAVGVGTVEDNSQITAVIENMINTLEVDEAALTSPAG